MQENTVQRVESIFISELKTQISQTNSIIELNHDKKKYLYLVFFSILHCITQINPNKNESFLLKIKRVTPDKEE
jgi:hypothetical protein